MKIQANGGTDATLALEKALSLLSENNWKEADVLTISDFEMHNLSSKLEANIKTQQSKNTKFYGRDEDDESSMASQYTDTFMDYAIEEVADMLLEEVGGNMTQQLFEQMKRNYNIPTVEEVENVQKAVGTAPIEKN